MADPLTILGTASSVVGIIEVLAKTMSRLRELNERWKQADFTFINLIAQLSALKAALRKLREWIDADMDETHHQLIMDLEVSITCCRMLIEKMDSEVSELQTSTERGFNTQEKMKFMIKNSTLEESQKMVERQTNALTLLLTACNCKAISEQKKLLEKSSSRKVFQQVKDDSSSLYCQRDSASISSWRTGNLSRISKLFEFDRELFVTKVYGKALQNSLKDAVNNLRRPGLRVNATPQETRTTAFIDQGLQEDSKKRKRECKVLLLGDSSCTQRLMNQMRISNMRRLTSDERALYQSLVRDNVLQIVEALASIIARHDFELEERTKIHATLLSRELVGWQMRPKTITTGVSNAVQGLWADERLQSALYASESVSTSISIPYFIKEIHRISQKDYIPTEVDILFTQNKASGIQEYKFNMGSLGVHVSSVAGQQSERMKWIHQFENVTSIVFSVDLDGYDQTLQDKSNQNQIMASLLLFESVVNSQWFLHTSVILLLCNEGLFRCKLARSPLSKYFPDYTGGNNVLQASEYIIRRFNQLNRMQLSVFPHLCEASESSNIRVVYAAIKDTIIFNSMRDSGIPVERKNSIVSLNRKGSNDIDLMVKQKGRGHSRERNRAENSDQDKNRDVWNGEAKQDENDNEDDVADEWIEDVVVQGNDELAAFEIGVAL